MKSLKRNLVMVLVLALALSSFSFADVTALSTKGFLAGEEMNEKVKRDGALGLFLTYAPEIYDEMVALKDNHVAIHTEITAIKDQLKAIRESRKADKKNLGQEMKSQYATALKNKEMTREEAKAAIKVALANQSRQKLIDETYKAQLEALRLEINANREERLAVRASIKTALADKENIDEVLLNTLLKELGDLRVAHYALDEEHLSILEDILAAEKQFSETSKKSGDESLIFFVFTYGSQHG
jgi:hypothetical protein